MQNICTIRKGKRKKQKERWERQEGCPSGQKVSSIFVLQGREEESNSNDMRCMRLLMGNSKYRFSAKVKVSNYRSQLRDICQSSWLRWVCIACCSFTGMASSMNTNDRYYEGDERVKIKRWSGEGKKNHGTRSQFMDSQRCCITKDLKIMIRNEEASTREKGTSDHERSQG